MLSPSYTRVHKGLVCPQGLLPDLVVGSEALQSLPLVFLGQQVADRVENPGTSLDQRVGPLCDAASVLVGSADPPDAPVGMVKEAVGPPHRFMEGTPAGTWVSKYAIR